MQISTPTDEWYRTLRIHDLNVAYWMGNTDIAVHTVGPCHLATPGDGVCDIATDGSDCDGVAALCDNCPNAAHPFAYNPSQRDSDANGVGDACSDCVGDCNLNGIVFGTEVTKTVLIFGERLELTNCLMADGDADGEVTMADITKAVLNLGLGCPSEHAGAALGGVGGGSNSVWIAPGDSEAISGGFFDVPINLGGSVGDVTALQIDLEYDGLAFEIADPAVDCTVDPSIASTHILHADAVSDGQFGQKRVRVGVRDPSVTATISDGQVGKCRFKMLLSSGVGGLMSGARNQAVDVSAAVIPSSTGDAFITLCPGCTCN